MSLVCCGVRWGQVSLAATLTVVMAVFVSVSILIFALSEESTPALQPAMSFSLVLLLDAVLSKGIRGLNFVVYVLGGQWKPDQQFKPGTYRSGVQFVRIVSSVALIPL